MKKETEFVDIYGHQFVVNTEKHSPIAGGQGEVLWTTEPNLLLKIAFAPDSLTEYSHDVKNNARYMDICLLPVPRNMNIATPQAVLKDYEGYVMTLLEDMEEFEKHFSVARNFAPETEVIRKISDGNEAYAKALCGYMGQGGIRRRYLAYMKAAVLLARLHANDLVYCDFSPRNIFISSDLDYQEVWIIDSDNLCYSESNENIVYTPKFCAPEIVSEDSGCTFYSDSYSFAISLFLQLFRQHPFEGKSYYEKINEMDSVVEADDFLNHGEFGWILDDESDNFDDEHLFLPYQIILTDEIFRLFQQEFSEMSRLEDETVRPSLSEWAIELAYAYDNIVYSNECGLDYVADQADFSLCPWDKTRLSVFRITSYYSTEDGKKLSDKHIWQYTHELDGDFVIPLRILNGFRCEEQDHKAFLISHEMGKTIIRSDSLPRSYKLKYSEDGIHFQSYGRFRMYENKAYIICHRQADCVNGIRDAHILLEVEIR